MCWYCYWGWPKPIADIYDKYVEIAGESPMHYGPAHIVWDDENFERHNVQWCLDHFEEHTYEDGPDGCNEAVRSSLLELLALPDEILDNKSARAYFEDDVDVEACPPPDGWEMVRR